MNCPCAVPWLVTRLRLRGRTAGRIYRAGRRSERPGADATRPRFGDATGAWGALPRCPCQVRTGVRRRRASPASLTHSARMVEPSRRSHAAGNAPARVRAVRKKGLWHPLLSNLTTVANPSRSTTKQTQFVRKRWILCVQGTPRGSYDSVAAAAKPLRRSHALAHSSHLGNDMVVRAGVTLSDHRVYPVHRVAWRESRYPPTHVRTMASGRRARLRMRRNQPAK